MRTRRQVLQSSSIVAAMLLGAGWLPSVAQAFQKNAFEFLGVVDIEFDANGIVFSLDDGLTVMQWN